MRVTVLIKKRRKSLTPDMGYNNQVDQQEDDNSQNARVMFQPDELETKGGECHDGVDPTIQMSVQKDSKDLTNSDISGEHLISSSSVTEASSTLKKKRGRPVGSTNKKRGLPSSNKKINRGKCHNGVEMTIEMGVQKESKDLSNGDTSGELLMSSSCVTKASSAVKKKRGRHVGSTTNKRGLPSHSKKSNTVQPLLVKNGRGRPRKEVKEFMDLYVRKNGETMDCVKCRLTRTPSNMYDHVLIVHCGWREEEEELEAQIKDSQTVSKC